MEPWIGLPMAQEVGSLDDVDGLRVWKRGDTEPIEDLVQEAVAAFPHICTKPLKVTVRSTQFKVQKLSQGTRESL